MKGWRELLSNERGTALALALIILVIMTGLGFGLWTLGGVEGRIAASQSASARARLLAEAGIEYALLNLTGVGPLAPDFSGKLASGTAVPGSPDEQRVLIANLSTMPGLTAAAGTFGVTIRNDRKVGDNLLTGAGTAGCLSCALAETGNATTDSNGVVILTSTGVVDGATRVIIAVVQRGRLNSPINAALTLPGFQADTTTDSPCQNTPCPPNPLRNYSIDGRDWLRSDTTTPSQLNPLKLGIATGSNATETAAQNGFDANSYTRNIVQGKSESDGNHTTGLLAINYDNSSDALTSAKIQAFMTNLAANPATQIIQSTQACQFAGGSSPRDKPEGLRMSSTASPSSITIKNNCGSTQTVNLGSATDPQLIYFKGQYDPSSNFVGVAVEGGQPIQGYGVLVVEDADLAFFQTGNFRWDGIVLVTGRNVAVAFRGSSNTEIRGALIGNETNDNEPGGYFEFFNRTTGKMVIRSSKENVDMALAGAYTISRRQVYREQSCSSTTPC